MSSSSRSSRSSKACRCCQRSCIRLRTCTHPKGDGTRTASVWTRPIFGSAEREGVALPQDMSHLLDGARQRLAAEQLTGRLSLARMNFSKPPPGFGSAGELPFRQQPSAREAGKVQCLGETPWESRATEIEPDERFVRANAAKVNQPTRFCASAAQSAATCRELMTFSIGAANTFGAIREYHAFAGRFGRNRDRKRGRRPPGWAAQRGRYEQT